MNKRTIYFIYLLILVSAIMFKTVKAYSPTRDVLIPERRVYETFADNKDRLVVKGISTENTDNGSRIVFKLNVSFKPVSDFNAKDNALILDFYDALIAPTVVDAFLCDGLKLGYIINLGKKVRVKLFLEQDCRASIVYSGKSVIVRIRDKKQTVRKIVKESPLRPEDTELANAVLSFENTPFKPIIKKLANEAGINVYISGNVPETISASFSASTPFEALKNIALENNLRFYRSGKVWYMAGA